MGVYRPNAVVAIGVIFILISILGFLIGTQPNATNPGYNYMMLYYTSALSYLYTHPPQFNPGWTPDTTYSVFMYLLATLMHINSTLTYLNLLPPMVLISETLSGAYLITTVGLFYMKKWGQRLGLIMGAVTIACGIISFPTMILIPVSTFMIILIPTGILLITFGILVIYYLRKVKNEFK